MVQKINTKQKKMSMFHVILNVSEGSYEILRLRLRMTVCFLASPKRIVFVVISLCIFTAFGVISMDTKVNAAPGINRTINFQGKVVNSNGTNVADGLYTFVFKIHDAPTGGSNPWTETQNNVQVTAGVFRVALGSVTSFASAGVDFNTDNLYLGINFNSDGEMTPRVRFAAVPYAINAEKVAGLTVTNTSGTLTIPNSKTVNFGGAFTTSAQDLTLTLSGGTNVTLPTTGTLATLGGIENLSNKSFTSTVTISGVATDITTGTNEALTLAPNGTGNVFIQTGAGGQAALVVDKTGLGDIFSASSAGTTKFVIDTNGTASSSAGFTIDGIGSLQSTRNQTLTVGGGSTGDLVIGRTSQQVWLPGFADCTALETAGGILSCGSDATGSGGGDNFWQYNSTTGIIAPGNLTVDTLFGATSSSSAFFKITGVTGSEGTKPVASVSARTSFAGLIVDNTIGDLFTASSSGVSQFTIKQNGAVGVGTTNPTQKLEVAGGNILISGTSATSGLSITNSGLPGTVRIIGDALFKSDGNFHFSRSAGFDYFRLKASGSFPVQYVVPLEIGTAFDTAKITLAPDGSANFAGKIGIATTSPLASLDVRHNSVNGGTVAVASVAGTTSFAGLVVDNTIGDLFTASSSGMTRFTIQQNGTVQIGSLTNGLTFDYLNGGPTYTGTARPTKTITLSPEFGGAVLTASGSSTTNGSMTSDASASASLNRTYYEWSSTQAILQDYVVAVRVTLPADFSGWATGNTMTIALNTGDTAATANALDIYMYNASDDSTGRPVYFSTNNVSSVDKTWTTVNLTSYSLDDGTSPDWDSAGETVTIYLKMKASGTYNYTQVGDITINYLAKF